MTLKRKITNVPRLENYSDALRLFTLALSRHSHKPINGNCSRAIKDDVGPKESKVSPAIVVAHIDLLQKLIGTRHGTVQTLLSAASTITRKITTAAGYVVGEEFLAGGSIGGLEFQNLIRGACNGSVGDCRAKETFDHVGERVDAVHKDPKARQRIRASKHSAESEHHDKYQVQDTSRSVGIGKAGNYHVGEA